MLTLPKRARETGAAVLETTFDMPAWQTRLDNPDRSVDLDTNLASAAALGFGGKLEANLPVTPQSADSHGR